MHNKSEDKPVLTNPGQKMLQILLDMPVDEAIEELKTLSLAFSIYAQFKERLDNKEKISYEEIIGRIAEIFTNESYMCPDLENCSENQEEEKQACFSVASAMIPLKEEIVKQIASKEFDELTSLLEKHKIDMETFCQTMREYGAQTIEYSVISSFLNLEEDNNEEDNNEIVDELLQAWSALENAFENKTNMSICSTYFDEIYGNTYDSISRPIEELPVFEIPFDNVFQKTPQAKALEKKHGIKLELDLFVQHF